MAPTYQISFYVPVAHCEQVKQAMFAAGAGRLGNYDRCAWQTAGQGQFRPLAGSAPFLGEAEQLETVEEYKVEMMCVQEHLHAAIEALQHSHPYETPAFSVVRQETP